MLAERLSTLATPEVASRILDEAVRHAAVPWVPVDGSELTAFANGSLREITERTLGEDSADALVADLVPLIRAMCAPLTNPDESQIRLTVRPELIAASVRPGRQAPRLTPVAPADLDSFRRVAHEDADTHAVSIEISEFPDAPGIQESAEFERVEPARSSQHRLVLASRSVDREREIANALDGHASVTRVEDVFDLVDHASGEFDGPVYVVLDGTSSAVRPTTLAAATAELPENTVVVLWGTPTTESDELDAIAPEAEAWKKLPDGTSTGELVRYLRSVFPARR